MCSRRCRVFQQQQSFVVGDSPVSGTAVFAEPLSAPPTYIFPCTSSTYSSDINSFDFQYLMYRPLYWFGVGGPAGAEHLP